MIRVTKIIGESFDLETKESVSKSLILTNGTSEIAIPISDEYLQPILRMMADSEIAYSEIKDEGPPSPKAPVKHSTRKNGSRKRQPESDDYDPGESYASDDNEASSI